MTKQIRDICQAIINNRSLAEIQQMVKKAHKKEINLNQLVYFLEVSHSFNNIMVYIGSISPLGVAIYQERLDVVELLVSNAANVNFKIGRQEDIYPLELAYLIGNHPVIDFLKEQNALYDNTIGIIQKLGLLALDVPAAVSRGVMYGGAIGLGGGAAPGFALGSAGVYAGMAAANPGIIAGSAAGGAVLAAGGAMVGAPLGAAGGALVSLGRSAFSIFSHRVTEVPEPEPLTLESFCMMPHNEENPAAVPRNL